MAEGSVNIDNAKSIGDGVLEKMAGKTVLEHKFARKQVNTLASSIYASVDGEKIEIDPQQLYQRLLVAGIGTIELTTLFQYELCSYPSSLFDKKLLMRLADKADLQHGIVKKVPRCVITQYPPGVHHVVDGGALLQRIPWPRHVSYDDICPLYGNYVQSHYQTATIIFDAIPVAPLRKMRHTNGDLVAKWVSTSVQARHAAQHEEEAISREHIQQTRVPQLAWH